MVELDPSATHAAVAMAAETLDDIENIRIANQNRLRVLTTPADVPDKDGRCRGFGLDERHPDVALLADMVTALEQLEKRATGTLEKKMRRHPLGPWVAAQKGIGAKQAARLLAAIGDPYWHTLYDRPRTVSELWAFCGLHVVPVSGQSRNGEPDPQGRVAADRDPDLTGSQAIDETQLGIASDHLSSDPGHRLADAQASNAGIAPKRRKGQRANWSNTAKMRAHLIAEKTVMQIGPGCKGGEREDGTRTPPQHPEVCGCSLFRKVYDARRAHTAVTHPEWTPGHAHNDALRVVAKEILKDLWRESKRLHEAADSDDDGEVAA